MNRKLSSSTPGWAAQAALHRRRAFLPCAVLAATAAVAGCLTTRTDFRLSSIGPGDAAIAGRITVIYNGQIYTENCFVTFGNGGKFKLLSDGIVLFRVSQGWIPLQRLACKDVSVQHVRIKGAYFLARGNGLVSDFGDVAITWEAVGGFKATALFGLVGGIVDEAIDDGVASIEVRPPVATVRAAFRTQTGVEGQWAVQQMTQPVDRASRAPTATNAPVTAAPATQHGFFCTSSAMGQTGLNICTREQAGCEQVRATHPSKGLAACAAAETAWCFATKSMLRCFSSPQACDTQ